MSKTLSKPKAETLTMPNGRVVMLPTDEEEAQINAGIAADPDAYEMTDAEFKQLRPLRGRPPSEVKRPMVSMRLDPDVLEGLRATGAGWQTRVNAILREAVERGKV
jgi:uncharacterized protein (DUF4415 family)